MRRLVIGSMAVVMALLAACGGSEKKGQASIVHARGATDLVLRVDVRGGFAPATFAQGHLPPFSLYGDGTLIVEGPQIEIFPPPALPSIVSRKIGEAGMQQILAAARDAGLLGPNRKYEFPMIADASSVVFTLIEGGRTHVIEAYALDEAMDDQLPAGDRAGRATLKRFRERLMSLDTWVDKGQLGQESQYVPTAMRVLIEPYMGDDASSVEPKEFPLSRPVSKFGVKTPNGLRCGIVANDDFAVMYKAARESNSAQPWHDAGKTYRLTFRPLLPDESGC